MSLRALIDRLPAAAVRRALARELGAPTGPVPKINVIDAKQNRDRDARERNSDSTRYEKLEESHFQFSQNQPPLISPKVQM